MPSQIGSKMPVSSRLGIRSPNEQPPAACALFTKVPEPARRSTSPAACRSLTARPIVMRETPNLRTSCASLGRRSEEHTSELQSPCNLVCRLLLEKKKNYCNKIDL